MESSTQGYSYRKVGKVVRSRIFFFINKPWHHESTPSSNLDGITFLSHGANIAALR